MARDEALGHLDIHGPDLTFHGDQTSQLEGRIFDRGLDGIFHVVQSAFYDPLLHCTDVWTRPATVRELQTSVFDEHGQRFLNPSGDAA